MEHDRAEVDARLEVAWHDHRRRAFDVAYRMLGSVAEAEDAVQEVYVRLLRADIGEVRDIRGWLITATARICIDHLQSARVRRSAYFGPWLPEPIVDFGNEAQPEDRVTLDESVRMALLVVLERLSPAERTSFVLHEVFQVPFSDVAAIVGRSPEACRQLARRARLRIADATADRFTASRSELARVTSEFAAACASGDLEPLLRVLDSSVVGTFDSGGRVPGAPSTPIEGRERVARVILRSFSGRHAVLTVANVNGEPGIVIHVDGEVVVILSLTVRRGLIVHIDAIGNPEKLAHLRS